MGKFPASFPSETEIDAFLLKSCIRQRSSSRLGPLGQSFLKQGTLDSLTYHGRIINSASSFRSARLRHYDGLERIDNRNILHVRGVQKFTWLVTDSASCSSHLLYQAQGSWFAYILPSALVNLSSSQRMYLY